MGLTVSQFPVTQEEMKNQLMKDRGPTVNRFAQVAKTSPPTGLEVDGRKELLKQHPPGEGSQGLILKSPFRNRRSFTTNLRSAGLQGRVLVGACGLPCTQYSQGGPIFNNFYGTNGISIC